MHIPEEYRKDGRKLEVQCYEDSLRSSEYISIKNKVI